MFCYVDEIQMPTPFQAFRFSLFAKICKRHHIAKIIIVIGRKWTHCGINWNLDNVNKSESILFISFVTYRI